MMKNLIFIIFVALSGIFLNGCENKIFMVENKIQPTSELDITTLGNSKYFSMQYIYQNHFKRAFIFN
ncbi:MAG: hypothetical protein K2N75_06670 [Helicobacter sp.]|uniref:hypothetical protein n=1 Tax=Helicobacter sp. TaxID=218 RepID=UPI0023C2AD4A|nr:hypothetical protein [Helicobacter sp.]MDE7175710.1 hypothetical protein [Helicobacter sp.]